MSEPTTIDDIIETAKQLGRGEMQTEILPILYELDKACAAAGGAMIDAHTPESIHNRFNEAWARIKRILHTIEQQKEATND